MDRLATNQTILDHGGRQVNSAIRISARQRCILLAALQDACLPLPEGDHDVLWEALAKGSPWAPFPSLQAWREAMGPD